MVRIVLLAVLGVVLVALTVVGLWPGTPNSRSFLLAIVLAGFQLSVLIYFLPDWIESLRRPKQTARGIQEWTSMRKDPREFGNRRRSRPRSKSRVFEPRPGLGGRSVVGAGRPHVRQASLRRQEELRVKQGRSDAARGRVHASSRRAHVSRAESVSSSGTGRRKRLNQPSIRRTRPAQISQANEERMVQLRIQQSMQYAAEDDSLGKHGSETAGERRKRTRLRKRKERFWRELDWGSGPC